MVRRSAKGSRIAAALLAVVAFIALAPAGATQEAPRYLAVVDAGSSGSRVTLFRALPDTGTPPEVLFEDKSGAGLSTFVTEPNQAGPSSIAPLLQSLQAFASDQGIATSEIPVRVLATAGMRLVRQENPEASRAIFDSVRATVADSGFPALEIGLMTGSDEAIYAWVDANALSDDLTNGSGSKGIIEVGGASAQVAYSVTRSQERELPTGVVKKVQAGGHTFRVVGLSYLGLGINEARGSMAMTKDGASPCYPNNGSGLAPEAYIVLGARTTPSASADFRPVLCGREMAEVISETGSNRLNRKNNGGVAFGEIRALPGFKSAKFGAVSSIAFTFKDFGVAAASNEKTALSAATRAVCVGPNAWNKVVAQYGGSTKEFAQTGCANASYTQEFLFGTSGLKVSPKTLEAQPDFQGESPSWSRGYALTVLETK